MGFFPNLLQWTMAPSWHWELLFICKYLTFIPILAFKPLFNHSVDLEIQINFTKTCWLVRDHAAERARCRGAEVYIIFACMLRVNCMMSFSGDTGFVFSVPLRETSLSTSFRNKDQEDDLKSLKTTLQLNAWTGLVVLNWWWLMSFAWSITRLVVYILPVGGGVLYI